MENLSYADLVFPYIPPSKRHRVVRKNPLTIYADIDLTHKALTVTDEPEVYPEDDVIWGFVERKLPDDDKADDDDVVVDFEDDGLGHSGGLQSGNAAGSDQDSGGLQSGNAAGCSDQDSGVDVSVQKPRS